MRKASSNKYFVAILVVAMVVPALYVSPLVGGEEPAGEARRHEAGRVHLVVDGRCSFTPVEVSGSLMRLRWDGCKGTEFLGGGGLFVRAEGASPDGVVQVGPEDMAPLSGDFPGRSYYEGCPGGVRGPTDSADDDSDGLIDEDPPDGKDNDGDGAIDEDFAAVGDEMLVSCSSGGKPPVGACEESYAWSYGHMRDFLGMSVRIEAGEVCDRWEDGACSVEAYLVLDFDIGSPDDAERGGDDEFYIVTIPISGGDGGELERDIRFLAVKDGALRGCYVGVLPLSASRGEGGTCVVEAEVAAGKSSPFGEVGPGDGEAGPSGEVEAAGEWNLFQRCVDDLFREGAGSALERTDGFRSEMVCRGDYEIVLGVRGGGGERLDLELAVVFGETEELLVRNALVAARTYLGVEGGDGGRIRWVAPARKARSLSVDVEPVTLWFDGERRPAVALVLPEELRFEDVEWLKLDGARTEGFEKAGKKVMIRLEGNETSSGVLTIEGQLTDGTIIEASCRSSELGMEEHASRENAYLPEEILQLFPNPFVSNLNISMSFYETGGLRGAGRIDLAGMDVSIKIYDVSGRLVKTVYEMDSFQPGDYNFTWNGLDQYGVKVSPGVYYCKLQIGERTLTKRVILLR